MKNCTNTIPGVNTDNLNRDATGFFNVGDVIYLSDMSFAHHPGTYFDEGMPYEEKCLLGVDCLTIHQLQKKAATVVHEPYIDSIQFYEDEIFEWFIDVEVDGEIWAVVCYRSAHYSSLEELEAAWELSRKLDEMWMDDYNF